MGLVGLVAGGVLAGLGSIAPRWARIVLGALLGVLGLAAGLLGCIFVFFWVATDHVVAHHNENMLQLSPLGLALAAFAPGFALGRPRATRRAAAIAALMAAISIAGLLLKVLPWFDQQNGSVIALCLPLWLSAAAACRIATPRSLRLPAPRAQAPAPAP
jgi:hypothetical protein